MALIAVFRIKLLHRDTRPEVAFCSSGKVGITVVAGPNFAAQVGADSLGGPRGGTGSRGVNRAISTDGSLRRPGDPDFGSGL
jgi:hypothetical protein